MVVQEFIEWEQFIRCICIGQDKVMPIKYDPRERRYHVEHDHMSPELGQRVIADSLKLVRALGYDMNSMEWAVRDGIPYAIDFMNPAPDMDIYSLTPHYFDWAVQSMADMAITLAKNPRRQDRALGWDALFTGTRHDDGSAGAASSGFAASGVAEGQQGSGSGGRTGAKPAAAEDNGGAMGSGGRAAGATQSAVDTASAGNGSSAGAASSGGGGTSSETVSRGAPGIYVDESPFPEVQPPSRAPLDPEQEPPAGGEAGEKA